MFTLMSSGSFTSRLLRMYLFPSAAGVLFKLKSLRRFFFRLVSQTDIRYTSSLCSGRAGRIVAGMRLPPVNNLYTLLKDRQTPFVLIFYNVSPTNFVPAPPLGILSFPQTSENTAGLKKAGFPGSFVLLLRPDNYIGYLSERFDEAELRAYCKKIFNEAK